jgi:hypothetical protein
MAAGRDDQSQRTANSRPLAGSQGQRAWPTSQKAHNRAAQAADLLQKVSPDRICAGRGTSVSASRTGQRGSPVRDLLARMLTPPPGDQVRGARDGVLGPHGPARPGLGYQSQRQEDNISRQVVTTALPILDAERLEDLALGRDNLVGLPRFDGQGDHAPVFWTRS